MTTPDISDHTWFQDRAAAYIAGGLAGADAQRFETHAAACAACAALLDDLTRSDATLRELFAGITPPADYEDKLIGQLQLTVPASLPFSNFPRLAARHPMILRAAAGVAAAMLVGTCGYFGSRAIEHNSLELRPSRLIALVDGSGSTRIPNLRPAQSNEEPETPDARIKRDAIRYEFHNALAEADRAMKNRNWDVAQNGINAARVAAGADPSVFKGAEVNELSFKVASAQEQLARHRANDGSVTSIESAETRRKSENREKSESKRTIAQLQQNAEQAVREGRYDQAQGINAQIRVLDPSSVLLTQLGTINDMIADGNTVTKSAIDSLTINSGGLLKSGTGALTLSGANNYAGGTTVSGGTLASLGWGSNGGTTYWNDQTPSVPQLIQNAQGSIRDGRYGVALGDIDRIRALDPNNDYAKGVRPLVEDKISGQSEGRKNFDRQLEKALNAAEEKKIAYDDMLRYPPNWPDISEVRDASVKAERAVVPDGGTLLGWQTPKGETEQLSRSHRMDTAKLSEQVTEALRARVDPSGARNLAYAQKPGEGAPAAPSGGEPGITTPNSASSLATSAAAGVPGSLGAGGVIANVAANGSINSLQLRIVNTDGSVNDTGTLTTNGESNANDGTGRAAAPAAAPGNQQAAGDGPNKGKFDNYAFYRVETPKGPVGAAVPAPAAGTFGRQSVAQGKESDGDGVADVPTGKESGGETRGKKTVTDDAGIVSGKPVVTNRSMSVDHAEGLVEMRQKTPDATTNVPPAPGKPETGKEAAIVDLGAGDRLTPGKTFETVAAAAGSTPAPTTPPAPAAHSPAVPTKSEPAKPPAAAAGANPDIKGNGKIQDKVFLHEVRSALAAATPPAPNSADVPTPTAVAQRRIIRNGELTFEVDSFDSASLQIAKIVGESGGFVDTTNSEKLPNGKVQGTVIVRCPPENLDVLVLKLRGLGDLKTQHIAAQDVTKLYTDIESQLKAARAMESRLLDLIKSGNGQIKDLLAAEKELGVWRQKIDGHEGEIRYYNNLISLSTLTVQLMERDIRAAWAAMESEVVSAGVETENVEQSRADALKAIEEAKGRVIESDLNKLEADQFKATIVAEVPAAAAGALIDRLRQLGHVARLDVQRKTTTEGGGVPRAWPDIRDIRPDGSAIPAAMAAGLKIERKQTRFDISLYNLATFNPKQTVAVTLACHDVEAAYRDILAAADVQDKPADAKTPARKVGRVVTSSLNSQRAGQVSGAITLEVRSEAAPQIEAIIRAAGEVMHLTVAENTDTASVTSSKRGFTVTLNALSQIPPRESAVIFVAARDVPALYRKLLEKLQDGKTESRVLNSELNEQDQQRVSGLLDFEISRPDATLIETMLGRAGESDVFQRNVVRAADVQNTVDSKVRLTLRLINSDDLKPREITSAHIESADVEQAAGDIASAAQGAGGRIVERRLSKEQGGSLEARLVVDVPMNGAGAVLDRIRAAGTVRDMTSAKNLQVPEGSLARAQFEVTLGNARLLVAPEDSVSARFHDALQTSVKGLLFVLQYLVVGVLLLGPIALIAWAIWRMFRRTRKPAAATPAAPSAPAA